MRTKSKRENTILPPVGREGGWMMINEYVNLITGNKENAKQRAISPQKIAQKG